MFYGPLSEACATKWAWDAHFVAYRCRAVEKRLAGGAALAHAPEMVVVIFDVDGPDHKCTPEWWAVEREKIHKLRAACGRCYCYTTRGGYRIVYGLAEPVVLRTPQDALRWRASYLDWVARLKSDFDIIADEACGDWTRLFRLPRTTREVAPGVRELQEPVEEIGEAARILDWQVPLCAEDDPRVTRPIAMVEIAPGDAAPVNEDALQASADALIAAWPKRGRHYAGLALCGALAKSGWTDAAILDFVGYVMQQTVGDAELSKWEPTIRTTLDKVARGEEVAGWISLAKHMRTGVDGSEDEARGEAVDAALLTARRAIGQGPAEDLFTVARPSQDVRAQLDAARAADDPLVRGLEGDRFAALLDEAATLLDVRFQLASKTKARDAKNVKRAFMPASEIFARNVPPPKFLVQYLIPEQGVGALSGEPKSGKSWDETHIAIALTSGKSVFGQYAVQAPVGVAVWYTEDPESSVNNRLSAIAREMGLTLDGVWVNRLLAQPSGRSLDVCSTFDMCVFVASIWLGEEEAQAKLGDPNYRVRLFAVDPLSNVHGMKENDRDTMAIVMAHLHAVAEAMTERAGVPVAGMFVHHSSKTNADNKGRKRGGQKMRGSSAVHGAVDFGIYVDVLGGDGKNKFIGRVESEVKSARQAGVFHRIIEITDNENGNAIKAAFKWEEHDPTVEEHDLSDDRAVTVVQKLFDQGGPMTSDELFAKVKGKKPIFINAVATALENGWIEQRYAGKSKAGYKITDAGIALVRDGKPGGSADPDTGAGSADPDKAPPGTPNVASALAGLSDGDQVVVG